jgi:hypothetical protein
VVRDGDQAQVWRVRNGVAERVAVRLGAERAGPIELLSGVGEGDDIVVRSAAELTDGAAVKTLRESASDR